MSETLKKELRDALDNPRLRYRLVEAWLNRKARESGPAGSPRRPEPHREVEEKTDPDRAAREHEAT